MNCFCSKCKKKYSIDSSKIPSGKKQAQCKQCGGIVPLCAANEKGRKCGKCGYIRKKVDTSPFWECPSCGVAYNKVYKSSPKLNRDEEVRDLVKSDIDKKEIALVNNLDDKKKKDILLFLDEEKKRFIKDKTLIAYVFISIVFGYFLGREHIKYEMRNIFFNAASNIDYKIKNNTIFEKKEIPKKISSNLISAVLLKKEFRDFDTDIGNKAIIFALKFTNNSKKNIRAFKGGLIFTDLLDTPVKKLRISINEPIDSYSSVIWDGEMDYNQFIDSDRSFRNKDANNLKVILALQKILYSDGTIEEF